MQTPHKRSFAAEELKRRQQKRPWLWTGVGILVVVVVIGGYMLYRRSVMQRQYTTELKQIQSIAVLPFRDLSPEKDQEWFCNGIAESILNALTNVKVLRVIASTSSFEFKGKDNSIGEIGRRLNVDAVLEGSVLKSGSRLLITAQLIRVSDKSHIFSKQYDRETQDLIAVVKEIPIEIVHELQLTIQPDEKRALEKRPTENLEAFNLYLQARHFGELLDKDELKTALGYLQQAIDLDPDFALAYDYFARLYYFAGVLGTLPRDMAFAEAQKTLDKALELDDSLADIYVTRGMAKLYGFFDFPGAEKEYKKAIDLKPGNAEAHSYYSHYLRFIGRFEEALAEIKRAQMLNPLDTGLYQSAIALYTNMERFEEGIADFTAAKELDPDEITFYNQLVRLYTKKGDYQKALELAKEKNREVHIALLSVKTGDRDIAKRILDEMIQKKENPCYFAMIYAALGDNDSAFEWLEKAYRERNAYLVYVYTDQEFDPLRSDPRFVALVKKIGFPGK